MDFISSEFYVKSHEHIEFPTFLKLIIFALFPISRKLRIVSKLWYAQKMTTLILTILKIHSFKYEKDYNLRAFVLKVFGVR